jgi:hypothetical protein
MSSIYLKTRELNYLAKISRSCFSPFSPINREFYLAKGTEKFILGRYLLSGILLMLLSLRPWGVAAIYLILLYGAFPILLHGRFVDRARETDILMSA